MGDELSDPYNQIMLSNASTLARKFRYLDWLIRVAMESGAPQQHELEGWIIPKHTVEVSEPFPEIEKVAGIFQEWHNLAVLTQH